MIKDNPDEKWSPIFTVRLEAELAERLRVASFTYRRKKQPLMRDAIAKLLDRENERSEPALRKKWTALAASQPETSMKEALRLTSSEDEHLRLFCFTYRLHKQLVTRVALIEYLDSLETGVAKRKR